MSLGSSLGQVFAGVILLVLVAGAAWGLYTGLRLRAAARLQEDRLRRLTVLEAASPAAAMLVRADRRVEMPQRLADWLGLEEPASSFSELSAGGRGIDPADAEALGGAITAAQRAARPFRLTVRTNGGTRTLLAIGERARDALLAPGGVVVWFFDATESEEALASARADTARLRDAFDALTGLIEAAPLPMWYRDRDLRLAMVNTAYVRAVEARDAEDVITRQVELVEQSGMGGPLTHAAIARDTGQPQAGAMPATIGGERRMLRVHDMPLPTGGTAGFAVDIEELEQARARIKRFAEAQRTMLDRLSAGVAQFAPDRTLIFCNQPFRRMFSIRPEWIVDRPEFDRVLERMREAKRLPEVRDFPGWKAERREWFLATEGAIEEAWHLPGGSHLRVVAQPLPDGGLLLVFEDRTEQVQLASARDTLLRVRTATFDNLFEALGVFAADGRLQIWNNKFRTVWGFDEALLATHPRVDVLAERAAKLLLNPARAPLMSELVRSATVERQQRGGRVAFADGRHFEFAAVPLPDGNALFTMLDISDSRRIEQALRDRNEALEEADRVRTAFVASMSYELRTPITSIQGFAEMLSAGYAGELPDAARDYAGAIIDSVQRLGALVDDVLDLTQNDGAAIDRVPLDVELVARGAAEAVRPLAESKRIDLAVDIFHTAGRIEGDQRRLRQAVEHLLRHAIANTREGGRVLLHVDGTRERARIVVSDNGPGMDRATAARAFERFAQRGEAREGERALGLGLPLAKRFVEAHGGTISLISEPGEGTLITAELPRA